MRFTSLSFKSNLIRFKASSSSSTITVSISMEVISQRLSSSSSSSTLNPNAPMFIPLAYRTVEDFSDQWWALVQSSPWFRDYWLQERYFDPQSSDPFFSEFDDLLLPDLDALFDDSQREEEEEEEERDACSELVSMGSLKWKKGRGLFDKPRCVEKAPKIVNVKVSPRMIQQPR